MSREQRSQDQEADASLDASGRAVWSEVDLDAVRANVARLRAVAAPAALLAVVKANGYGHGAVPVAPRRARCRRVVARRRPGRGGRAAARRGDRRADHAPLRARADGRGRGGRGRTSRRSSTPRPGSTRWRRRSPIRPRLSRSTCTSRSTPACTASAARPTTRSRSHARSRRATSSRSPGVCTHLAVADEPDNPYTAEQLARFDAVLDALDAEGLRPPLAHAANSAGLLVTGARYDLVRVGIACYGLPPAPGAGRRSSSSAPRCRSARG